MKTVSRIGMRNALLGMLFAGLSLCAHAGAVGKSTPADSRPKDDVTPKGYAEQLRRDAKVGPLVKKYLAPFEDEIQKVTMAAFTEMMQQAMSKKDEGDSEEAEKAQFELSQKMAAGLVEKYKAFRDNVVKAKIPQDIEDYRVSLLGKIDDAI